LIIVAGRPGQGKSAFSAEVCRRSAHMGVGSVQFQLEMSDMDLAYRMACAEALVPSWLAKAGSISRIDLDKINSAAMRLGELPMWVDATPGQAVEAICRKSRRLKAQNPEIGIIVVDYIQLLAESRQDWNRTQNVGHTTRTLKSLAKELDLVVYALAQLNRNIEKVDRPRAPQLSDLRESGSVEQDAHLVIILHHPKLSEKEEELVQGDWSKTRRRINALICKQRNGPTGDAELMYWKESMVFQSFKLTEHTP